MIALEQASVISDKDKEFLSNVKEVVRRFQPSAEMLLFGSVARGTQAEESDFDVLILTDNRLSGKEEDEVEDALYDLQLAWGVLVCTVFYSKDEWESPFMRVSPIHREVERDAIVL